MDAWPVFSDFRALQIILFCILLWTIVGCDKPSQAPASSAQPVAVAPASSTPVATATLRSKECPWGQAIMGC